MGRSLTHQCSDPVTLVNSTHGDSANAVQLKGMELANHAAEDVGHHAHRKPVARRESAIATRDFWKSLEFEKKQRELEAHCFEIAEQQDASSKERKKLADLTKNYRRLTDEEKLAQQGAFVKAYQEEVDRLTRRAKSAEGHVLALYKVGARCASFPPVLPRSVCAHRC